MTRRSTQYETRQTGLKPGTHTPRSRRLWIGASEDLAFQAAEAADIANGAITVTRIDPAGDRKLLYTRTTSETIDHRNDNDTKGTSDMTTTENTTTETTIYICYVWNAEGKVKGKPQERKTLTGAITLADKASATPGIREVTILGTDGSRRVSRHGSTTVVTDAADAPAPEPAATEATPAPAQPKAEAKAEAKAKDAPAKNPAKVAAAKATVKPKVVATVEVEGKPSAKVKLLDYKGANTAAAKRLPKGARWVAYDPATARIVPLAKKPTDAELANPAKWDELAMPKPEEKATEAA